MATAVLSRIEPSVPRAQPRSLLLASADAAQTLALRDALVRQRWQVREVRGAAEAMAELEERPPEVLVLDRRLPDMEVNEFAEMVLAVFPLIEVLRTDGHAYPKEARSPRRPELLLTLRAVDQIASGATVKGSRPGLDGRCESAPGSIASRSSLAEPAQKPGAAEEHELPGMIGRSAEMRELNHLIRLVAPRDTTVLIEGPTGSGKELVAHALHVLSKRATQTMAVLNCAAIPEALLEAELFGHTRGAFTGATQSRIGRIEAADGGTLFLDEIGEMPLALQAKMLRFLECGEIQRVGDNAITHVNVRVVAATHQPLEQRSAEGTFRLDLYHRLAVFPVEIPSLASRMDDLPLLAEHFLVRYSLGTHRKRLSDEALEELMSYGWGGNVRELMHVLERATILSADAEVIDRTHIRLRRWARA